MDAFDTEIQGLDDNGTWEVAPLPPGVKAIHTKAVFDIKTDEDGELDKYKARVCVRGDHQVPGQHFDPDSTFSPVASDVTLYILVVLALKHAFRLYQLDVKHAFLNSIYSMTKSGSISLMAMCILLGTTLQSS